MQTTFIKIVKERKVIDGNLYRKYFIDSEGTEIGIPPYIYYGISKGSTYIKVDASKFKHLKTFGAQEQYHDIVTEEIALKRCITIVKNILRDRHVTAPKPRLFKNKTCKLATLGIDPSQLPSGVSLIANHDRSCIKLSFCVSVFDRTKNKFRSITLYIGTLNNWKDRYETKLKEAVALRQESLKEYSALIESTKQ